MVEEVNLSLQLKFSRFINCVGEIKVQIWTFSINWMHI